MKITNVIISLSILTLLMLSNASHARYLQPDKLDVLGRANDPELLVGAGMGALRLPEQLQNNHLYGYAGQNPANNTDPYGLFPTSDKTPAGQAAMREAVGDAAGAARANKINHIFNAPKHNLDDFLKQCKDKDDALKKIEDAFKDAAKDMSDGPVEVTVDIGGHNITIRGNVSKGSTKVGTAFVK